MPALRLLCHCGTSGRTGQSPVSPPHVSLLQLVACSRSFGPSPGSCRCSLRSRVHGYSSVHNIRVGKCVTQHL